MTASTPASNQFVITPLPDFRLGVSEPLPVGLKRLTTNELANAASRFYDGEEAFATAVHGARKSTKRVRAVLRLVRSDLGKKVYAYEYNEMRAVSRRIASVRDSFVAVECIDTLDRLYGHLLADGMLEETRQNLDLKRRNVELRAMEDPELVLSVVETFERAHGRYANWPIDQSSRPVYGSGVRDEFAAIRPGLKQSYRRGRNRMVRAYSDPTVVKFHEWRRSVKYLRHQMEILTPLWPEVVVGMAVTLERVGEILGQDHDLAMLTQRLAADPSLCPDPALRSLILAIANQRRSDLQTAARILGRRVFAERPDAITGRYEVYWESRDSDAVAALELINL
ncbi:MAG TPA: CHAD domain-containing protein [Acidimicrobiia bacterium]